MSNMPKDVGCKNDECVKSPECNRRAIAKNKTAREIKSFGGNKDKGCGKFLSKE